MNRTCKEPHCAKFEEQFGHAEHFTNRGSLIATLVVQKNVFSPS